MFLVMLEYQIWENINKANKKNMTEASKLLSYKLLIRPLNVAL